MFNKHKSFFLIYKVFLKELFKKNTNIFYTKHITLINIQLTNTLQIYENMKI